MKISLYGIMIYITDETEVKQEYLLLPIILTIQGLACLCLTYYILIIEFVKITIDSNSPLTL